MHSLYLQIITSPTFVYLQGAISKAVQTDHESSLKTNEGKLDSLSVVSLDKSTF